MKNRTAWLIGLVVATLAVPSLSVADLTVTTVSTGKTGEATRLTPEQLEDLVAPIALYPDGLLSQVLVASTYPLEVVEAQQWLRRNPGLKGKELTDAARAQPWDASVQGLVAFPDALETLNQDIQWTTALGNAFLAQEADVMAAVQRMRARAREKGALASTDEQNVTTVVQEGQTVIQIEPADPEVVYVPRYDPVYVWGAPSWYAYPPLAYPYGYGFGVGIDVAYWFGGWSWAWGWGWGPSWWGGSVYVYDPFFRHCGYHHGRRGGHGGDGHGGGHGGHGGDGHGGGGGHGGGHGGQSGDVAGGQGGRERWQHDGTHRMGVPYSDRRVAARHQADSLASRTSRTAFGDLSRSRDLAASRSGSLAPSRNDRGVRPDDGWRTADRPVAAAPRGTRSDDGRRVGDRPSAAGPRGVRSDEGWRTANRTVAPAPRGTRSDDGWRAGQRSVTPRSAGERSDQAWRTSREPARPVVQPRREGPSSRYTGPSRSYSPSSPSRGYSAPSPGFSGPSRSYSPSTPSRGYSAPSPRSFSSGGGARSSGGGGAPGGGRRH